jgi:hypothetical protein
MTDKLIEALERIAELDKFGGYNSACDVARKALATYRQSQPEGK